MIAGLCYWLADRFKYAYEEVEDLAQVGIAATLGVIFHAPLFGFVNQVEDEKGGQAIPKNSKILLYFIAIFAGFGVYILLSGLFGGGMGLGRFGHITIGRNELLAMLPLALVGALCGILYFYFAKGVKVVTAPLEKHKVFLGIIGGLVLGGVGMLLPFTMFAGEHQMGEMMEIWQTLPIWLLFLTGIVKLLMINICIGTGWRGGNIFPIIFSAVCIGSVSYTHLMIAFMMDKHDTIGIDAVAMCVNDILCQGAKPLFFLDYIACGKNYPEKIAQIVSGVAEGCVQGGMALIGGETAEMPDMYSLDDYDLAGFAVGVVEKDEIITGQSIAEGDVLVGLPSSGVHSNGFSLVRKLLFKDLKMDVHTKVDELGGTLGEALLTPTRIYVKAVEDLLAPYGVKGMSHVTGGGFYENIPRMIPEGLCAKVDTAAIDTLPKMCIRDRHRDRLLSGSFRSLIVCDTAAQTPRGHCRPERYPTPRFRAE